MGYGPFRVRRLFDITPIADARLRAAASKLSERAPVAAYALLGDKGVPRLSRLGPAFGTKFLYFCSRPESARAHPRPPCGRMAPREYRPVAV